MRPPRLRRAVSALALPVSSGGGPQTTRAFTASAPRSLRRRPIRQPKAPNAEDEGINVRYDPEEINFWNWVNGDGRRYRESCRGMNYLPQEFRRVKPGGQRDPPEGVEGKDGKLPPREFNNENQPFPQNKTFRSLPVLGESARALIYEKVATEGQSIKAVSSSFGVDQRRVAAVVRLMEVEQRWREEGKRLARPYAKAILSMLPQRYFRDQQPTPGESTGLKPFEPINEIPTHPYTLQQLFVPVAESRPFTRQDAAAAFHRKMKSADERVPHPELVQLERDKQRGGGSVEAADEAVAKFLRDARASEEKVAQKRARAEAKEEKRTTKVDGARCEFRFKDVSVDDAGRDGRDPRGTGWRYGLPFYDRKVGQVKIPTRVE